MKVKCYEKSYNGTLAIVGHKIAVQRDSSKYRIWSITHTGDKEMPVQQDGCSAWVDTGDGEFTCIEPIVNECVECEECGALHAPGENTMCNR